MSDLRQEIVGVIAAQCHLDPARFRPEATLAELGLTSIDLVEIVFAIEEHFDIELPYHEPALDGRPLGDLVPVVERLVLARRAP